MRKLLILTAVACAVVLVAAPVAAGRALDQEIADNAVLTVDDLPDGWTEEPRVDDEELETPECEKIDRAVKRGQKRPTGESPQILDPDDPNGITGVQNDVTVFPKAKGAKRQLRPYKRTGEDCALSIAEESGADEFEVEELDVEDIGDAGVGYSILLTGEGGSLSIELYVIRVGRAIVALTTASLEEPLPIGPELLETVVDRLEEEL